MNLFAMPQKWRLQPIYPCLPIATKFVPTGTNPLHSNHTLPLLLNEAGVWPVMRLNAVWNAEGAL